MLQTLRGRMNTPARPGDGNIQPSGVIHKAQLAFSVTPHSGNHDYISLPALHDHKQESCHSGNKQPNVQPTSTKPPDSGKTTNSGMRGLTNTCLSNCDRCLLLTRDSDMHGTKVMRCEASTRMTTDQMATGHCLQLMKKVMLVTKACDVHGISMRCHAT